MTPDLLTLSTYYLVDRRFHKRRTDRLALAENLSDPLRGSGPDYGLRSRVRHHELGIAYRGPRKLSADDICPSDPYLTVYYCTSGTVLCDCLSFKPLKIRL